MERRLLDVEPLREMQDGRRADDHCRKPPRTALAAREAAREPDQPEPEREHERPRRAGDARRQNPVDEVQATGHLGRQRGRDRERAREGGTPGKQEGRRGAAHPDTVPSVRPGRLPLPGRL